MSKEKLKIRQSKTSNFKRSYNSFTIVVFAVFPAVVFWTFKRQLKQMHAEAMGYFNRELRVSEDVCSVWEYSLTFI